MCYTLLRRNRKENVIKRFGVSLPGGLLKKFDDLNAKKGYGSRSEAIRDLVRAALARELLSGKSKGIGVLSYVYDHHVPNLLQNLTAVQHDHEDMVVSSMHIHIDHDSCLEVVILQGRVNRIKAFADRLICTKGVKHGDFSLIAGAGGLL